MSTPNSGRKAATPPSSRMLTARQMVLFLVGPLVLATAAVLVYYVPIPGLDAGEARAAVDAAELEQKRAALEEWQQELAQREAELQAREAALAEQEAKVAALLQAAAKAGPEAEPVELVARMLESLPPQEAVPLLADLEPAVIARHLQRIDQEHAAAILFFMEQEQAAKVMAYLTSQPSGAGK